VLPLLLPGPHFVTANNLRYICALALFSAAVFSTTYALLPLLFGLYALVTAQLLLRYYN
jgi:hypothetical protein